MVQYTPLALPNVRDKAEHPILDITAKLRQPPKRAAPDKLQKGGRNTSPESKLVKFCSKLIKDHTVSRTAHINFPSEVADVYLTTRPTYHLQPSYVLSATAMQTAHSLFNTGGDVSIIRSSKIPTNWNYCIKRDGVPTLCTATEQPLPLDGFLLQNLLIGDLNARVWFKIPL